MVARFVAKPEAFMQRIISLITKTAIPRGGFIIRHVRQIEASDDLFLDHPADTDRPFQFQKRCQLFTSAHDETLSVEMRVHNPDRSPLKIDS